MPLMDNKKTYDFNVYAPAVLGNAYKHCEILGYFPYETAILLNGEIAPMHAEVYSTGTLPANTPNDPRQYNYYRIKKADGTITMLGEVWIDQTSIQEVMVSTGYVVIPNLSTTDVPRLMTLLSKNGFINAEIGFGDPISGVLTPPA